MTISLKNYLIKSEQNETTLGELKHLEEDIHLIKFLTAYHQFKLSFEKAIKENIFENSLCKLHVQMSYGSLYLYTSFLKNDKINESITKNVLSEEANETLEDSLYYKGAEIRTLNKEYFGDIYTNAIEIDTNKELNINLNSVILSKELQKLYEATLLEINLPETKENKNRKIKI